MTATLVTLTLVWWTGQSSPPVRQSHPLAPSVPLLTREEEKKIEKIIDRFILFDIGKLPKSEGKQAVADFNSLGPEAIFQLIEAFNQAANFEHSCPAVIIGKKIGGILNRSDDLELLAFARENIGTGVTAKRHLGVIKDLQFGILIRRGTVQRQLALAGNLPGTMKAPAAMSPAELARAAGKERGPRLRAVLQEVAKRPDPLALDILALAATRPEKDAQDLAQGLLVEKIGRQSDSDLRKLLKHETPELRVAAAKACTTRRWGSELIDLLDDPSPAVQGAAHQGLVSLNRGIDLGPENLGSPGDRATAVVRWRTWWSTQKSPR